jgi:hypothetical protein
MGEWPTHFYMPLKGKAEFLNILMVGLWFSVLVDGIDT